MKNNKLTPAQRQHLAVLRIEAKRRETFEKGLRTKWGVSNIGTNGVFYRNSQPPRTLQVNRHLATGSSFEARQECAATRWEEKS